MLEFRRWTACQRWANCTLRQVSPTSIRQGGALDQGYICTLLAYAPYEAAIKKMRSAARLMLELLHCIAAGTSVKAELVL